VPERFFTPEEANEALEVVRPLAERMVGARAALLRAQRQQAELVTRIASNGGGLAPSDVSQAAAEVERASRDLMAAVDELQGLGVLVKDLDSGLVDFPCLHRGRELLLCWQLGEDEVAYWHGLEDGFAGRRPLPLD
jgi:hypothetical protein